MNGNFWVADSRNVQSPFCKKRKRRVGKRKIEFVGWGSKPLIEFLEAIGKDTMEKHTQQEVASYISKYINDKGLASAEKKKKVLCDDRLYALFLKKTISRIKVHEMLEEHFAENHNDSDDELLDSSDEDYEQKRSIALKNIPTGQTKKALKTPKSCFAAVIPENIKLVYLKRTVIQNLLKFPESFEFKIVGSFVRMKTDPNDIYQKNRFQLQQVTGIEKVSVTGDADIEIRLKVSNFFKDVTICMLSDDNFTEEEVKDVCDRIKAGFLNRLTVNELQSKAQVLHVDITNNWIAKEVSLLQNLAERANEKGWQREKFEYLERKKMLLKPYEQEKILSKVPEVVAEELEPEVLTAASENAELIAFSPKSILRGSSDVSSADASGSGEMDNLPPKVISSDSHYLNVENGGMCDVVYVPLKDPKADIAEEGMLVANLRCAESIRETQGVVVANVRCAESSRETQGVGSRAKDVHEETNAIREVNNRETGMLDFKEEVMPQQQQPSSVTTPTVIELSDDEPEDKRHEPEDKRQEAVGAENPDAAIWYYADPQGQRQGPFPLSLLKKWSDGNYFHPSFTVWKTGETSHYGFLLLDLLRRNFPF